MQTAVIKKQTKQQSRRSLWSTMVQQKWMYVLAMPGILYFILFKFAPLWGLLIAFKEYNPYKGLWGSSWIGLTNFTEMFASQTFYIMLRNTFAINIFGIIFMFPVPILLALMLNEVRHEVFKRINQSIVYLPHFLSWVVVASMTFFMLSTDVGIVNKMISGMGFETVSFYRPRTTIGD